MRRRGSPARAGIRSICTACVAALSTLVLAACGGSSSDASMLDPAAIVPAGVPLYVGVRVPDGDQLDDLRAVITAVGGDHAWDRVMAGFDRPLARHKLSWSADIAPWIGSRFGLASMNGLDISRSSSDRQLVLIFPTNHMTSALSFARRATATVSGTTYARDGRYLLVGDRTAINQLTAAHGNPLNQASSYVAVHSPLGSDSVAVYAAIKPLAEQLETRFIASARPAQRARLSQQLSQISADAAVGFGVGVTRRTLAFDLIPYDLPGRGTGRGQHAGGVGGGSSAGAGRVSGVSAVSTRVAAGVAGLPADSIVALALDLTAPQPDAGVSLLHVGGASSTVSGAVTSLTGRLARAGDAVGSVLARLLPALGPLELAIGGTSLLGIHGGLSLTLVHPAAARRLVSSLFSEIQHNGSVGVAGTSRDFTLHTRPFRVKVSETQGRVLALLGYARATELLAPASTLSSDATFQIARRRLPAGSRIPFYVSFTGLDRLLSAFSDGKLHAIDQVVHRLSYLILGTTRDHTRLVLGLN